MASDIEARVEATARASWGKLVALLASRSGDIARAEDHLAEAFARALAIWPAQGIPGNPEGWLLASARNLARDAARSASNRLSAALDDEIDAMAPETDPDDLPDVRLKLMFACAHPAIDASLHTPLILQTVLAIDAARIARAFLVPADAMAQRLVRAKQKIKQAGVPFAIPGRDELSGRTDAVLEAIYGAYAIHWADGPAGAETGTEDLGREALFLADLMARLLPEEPEAAGLAALIAHIEARRGARHDASGAYVPLDRQDMAAWDGALVASAERTLREASRHGRPGRFQIEAAIQSAHAARATTGAVDWSAIVMLYEGLLRLAPSIGAVVGLAAALGQAGRAREGLACLDAFADGIGPDYQPAWATRAMLLTRSGQPGMARAAYDRAIRLAGDGPMARHLAQEKARLADAPGDVTRR